MYASSLFGTVKAILKDKGKKPGKKTASERYIASHLLLCVIRAYQICEKIKKKKMVKLLIIYLNTKGY